MTDQPKQEPSPMVKRVRLMVIQATIAGSDFMLAAVFGFAAGLTGNTTFSWLALAAAATGWWMACYAFDNWRWARELIQAFERFAAVTATPEGKDAMVKTVEMLRRHAVRIIATEAAKKLNPEVVDPIWVVAPRPEDCAWDFPIMENLLGVPWHEAPIPSPNHECRPQTKAWIGLKYVERCACGATRRDQTTDDLAWFGVNIRRFEQQATNGKVADA